MKIYSEPGEGTAVKIYMPRLMGAATEDQETERSVDMPLGDSQEVVLVVEDEAAVRQFSVEAVRRRADLKVLFTTGYTRNAVVHNGVLDPGVQLIGKPYTIEELAARVREVLDAG